jgi:hypothetical protein
MKRSMHSILLASLIITGISIWAIYFNTQVVYASRNNNKSYLPLITNGQTSDISFSKKFIGLIEAEYWDSDQKINTKLVGADNWAGKKHSVVGWFIDIEDPNPSYNLKVQLDNLWKDGYTSFINLNAGSISNSRPSAADIASGKFDSQITNIAKAYAAWIRLGGGRKAFIAPLQEMNGYWQSYGQDPGNYKLAYGRIRSIFANQGITADKIWWVFAPNGWSRAGSEFEKYYPGDDQVDVIAFSSYNYGYCSVAIPWQQWEDSNTLYKPYLDRISAMAPNKPVIIAQTGSSAQYPSTNTVDKDKKNAWLVSSYNYLASQKNVVGVLYYDMDISWECDWAIFNTNSKYDSYKTAAANSGFTYFSPQTLSSMDLEKSH